MKQGRPAQSDRAGTGGIISGDVPPADRQPGDVLSGAVFSGDVPPADRQPGDVASGAVFSADLSSGDVLSGAVPSDDDALLRGALSGVVLPGRALPDTPPLNNPAFPAAELLPAGPAYRGPTRRLPGEALPGDAGPDETGAAAGGLSDELGQDELGQDELGQDEMTDVEAEDVEQAGSGLEAVQPGESEPEETLASRIMAIGLLSGGGQVALAGAAPDVSGVRRPVVPRASELLDYASQAAEDWAIRRCLGLTSACGISVALAVCAAAWFSAGTRTDILRGVGALWAGYLALKAGRLVSAPQRRRDSVSSDASAPPAGLDVAAQVILRPGQGSGTRQAAGTGEQRARRAGADRVTSDRRPAAAAGWLAALGSCLAECVVYAGLAVGGGAERWTGVWPLAIAVLGLVAVRNLMTVCSTPRGFGDRPEGAFRQLAAAALTMPAGGRVLLIGVVAPIWGAKAALVALLEWAIISVGYGLAGRAKAGISAVGSERSPGRTSLVLRLRDDGALARALGLLVRGSLLPLPPALLGLAAISALAVLGLHDLPAALMIGPAVVMLLAAPGSAHPHTGRFDWLVPALLLGSQILYITAVGLGAHVPGPIIFVLGAALLIRYTDLAFPGRPVMLARSRHPGEQRGERGSGLGWEGRLLLIGLSPATGIATFAYLALTAYLGLLICAKVVTASLAPREEDARDRSGPGGRRKPPPAS